jgi:hypothetical protein
MLTADTRAAAGAAQQEEQQQPADASQGTCDLDLVLSTAGHLLDQRDVCALPCTSKATAACVARSCGGQLAVKARPKTLQQAQLLARWLGAHSSLPRSLDVQLDTALQLSQASESVRTRRPQTQRCVLPQPHRCEALCCRAQHTQQQRHAHAALGR